MDDATFDPDAVDEDGLPLVYNEQRIASFWRKRPGELTGDKPGFVTTTTPLYTAVKQYITSMKYCFFLVLISDMHVAMPALSSQCCKAKLPLLYSAVKCMQQFLFGFGFDTVANQKVPLQSLAPQSLETMLVSQSIVLRHRRLQQGMP